MLELLPFAAVRPARGCESKVACPPYDVVSRDEARASIEANARSFLRVIRPDAEFDTGSPPADAMYQRAQENYAELLRSGYLTREDSPSLYIYRLAWNHHAQIGVVGCCAIEQFSDGTIRKHERTRPDKVEDRTRLLHAVKAHTGPIFLAYREQESINQVVEEVINERPLYHFNASDGVTHTLWRVARPERIASLFGEVPTAYVADGHHRVASAELGAEQQRQSGQPLGEYGRMLCVLFPANQLRILPYNRLIHAVDGKSADDLLRGMERMANVQPATSATPARPGIIHCFIKEQWHAVTLPASTATTNPADSLDAARLHAEILTPTLGLGDPRTDDRCSFIGGPDSTSKIERAVRTGDAMAGFSLVATTMEQLMAVADAGLVMPPKSTWFEPKLRSGLLIHALD